MKYWIRRGALIAGLAAFFVLFFVNLNYEDPFGFQFLVPALLKGVAGAALFWLAGFVAGDILLKGVVTDIYTDNEDLLDGGLLQRMHDQKGKLTPGGSEMPFTRTVKQRKKDPEKSGAANAGNT